MAESSIRRVLITGATGFMGSRLCEVLFLTRRVQPRAFIHSTASAARIARFPIDFVLGDLTDRATVGKAMQGCDAVIHLARGDDQVMLTGLDNVLASARDHKVSRVVHMSSVAVYGNAPPSESRHEDAVPNPGDMAYGHVKLEQERRVLRAYRAHGLPVVILRPPNVYGPYSAYTTGIIQKIRSRKMAIVDGGTNPCNLVYIDNLMEAILLSLWKPQAIGQTFFITDRDVVSWEQHLHDHAALVGESIPNIRATDLCSKPTERMFRDTVATLPRVLLSGELRALLRGVPLIRRLEEFAFKRFLALPADVQQRLRLKLNGPQRFAKIRPAAQRFDRTDNIIAAQGRTVAHSCEKAQRLLGYSAPVGRKQALELTESWLRYARII